MLARTQGPCAAPLRALRLSRAAHCGPLTPGFAHLSRNEIRNAYDAFTEAIRLSPRKVSPVLADLLGGLSAHGGVPQAAYHANRAAVALQLANMAGAVEDAEEAIRLNPQHVAARMRAAKAHLALRQPLVRASAPDTAQLDGRV